jgi:hypothetical protein
MRRAPTFAADAEDVDVVAHEDFGRAGLGHRLQLLWLAEHPAFIVFGIRYSLARSKFMQKLRLDS